jgi:hypothetical protein
MMGSLCQAAGPCSESTKSSGFGLHISIPSTIMDRQLDQAITHTHRNPFIATYYNMRNRHHQPMSSPQSSCLPLSLSLSLSNQSTIYLPNHLLLSCLPCFCPNHPSTLHHSAISQQQASRSMQAGRQVPSPPSQRLVPLALFTIL